MEVVDAAAVVVVTAEPEEVEVPAPSTSSWPGAREGSAAPRAWRLTDDRLVLEEEDEEEDEDVRVHRPIPLAVVVVLVVVAPRAGEPEGDATAPAAALETLALGMVPGPPTLQVLVPPSKGEGLAISPAQASLMRAACKVAALLLPLDICPEVRRLYQISAGEEPERCRERSVSKQPIWSRSVELLATARRRPVTRVDTLVGLKSTRRGMLRSRSTKAGRRGREGEEEGGRRTGAEEAD